MTVASCPSCQESVTVPVDATADCVVRCPLCNEEFTLEAFLRQLPPTLIILDKGSGIGAEIGVRDGSQSSTDLDASSSNVLGPLVTTGTTIEASDSVPAFDFTPGSADQQGEESVPTAPRHSPRRQKNPTVEVIKIVAGGLLAIPAAQIILWWFVPGDWKRDPLHIGPAVSRVVPWVVPERFRDQNTDAADDTPLLRKGQRDSSAVKRRRARPRAASGSAMPRPGSGHASTPPPGKQPDDRVGTVDSGSARRKQPNVAPPVAGGDQAAPTTAQGKPAITKPAKPSATASSTVVVRGVRGAPQYNAAEMRNALEAAVQASVAWDTDDPDQSETHRKQLDDQFYESFARLSESVTYPPPHAPETGELVGALSDMLATFAKQPKKLAMIGNQTSAWLDQSTRPNQGIFVFGTVKQIRTVGSLFETDLELAARKKRTVTVVSRVDPRHTFAKGDRILMLGAIVEEPNRNLLGYEGHEPMVVMGGFPVLMR